MKNQFKILVLAALTTGAMSLNGMSSGIENINVPKIVTEVREFAMQVPTASVAEINVALEKALANIPSELLGIDVTTLPEGKVDAETANKIGNYLPQAKQTVDQVNAFVQMPDTTLQLFETVYQTIASQLPMSIQNTVSTGLIVANMLVNSTDPTDQAAIKAMQEITSDLHQIIIRLSNAQANGRLVGYQARNEINVFKASVLSRLPVIQAAIARHMEGITDVIQQGSTITLDDLNKVGEAAQNLATGLGF